MPSSAVVAGAIAGVLAITALGLGLGLGLRDNDDDKSPATAEDVAAEEEAGSRDIGAGVVQATDAVQGSDGPSPSPSPIDSTFAFAPTPSRAFGPDFAPTPGAPINAPLAGVAPAPVAPVPADEATVPAPVPAPVPVPVEAPVPGPEPAAEEPAETPAPAPAPDAEEIVIESGAAAGGVVPGADGKYAVCPGSFEDRSLGNGPNQACGVTVNTDGSVVLGEYFGGFDGYWSVDPSDGHENCFNHAIAEMFQQEFCETVDAGDAVECQEPASGSCVCFAVDKDKPAIESQRGIGGWPGNQGIIKFLTDLRDTSNPKDFDFPEDEQVADDGGRVANVVLATAVFEDFITVGNC